MFTNILQAIVDCGKLMSKLSSEKRKQLLEPFVEEILEPCLIWKAGRSAESIRTMATQALCAIGQAAPDESKLIFPKYTVILNALVDDSNAITRTYALRTIMASGPFTPKEYSELAMSKCLFHVCN